MTNAQKETLKWIRDTYDLQKEHFYIHKHYVIVNKIGVHIIAKAERLKFEINIIHSDGASASVDCLTNKRTGGDVRSHIRTFASSNTTTNKNGYHLEMAIKRAKAKAVLTYIDAYQKGIYSEDEAEEFKDEKT